MTYKFIEEDSIEFTALDATEVTELEVSGIFVNQEKKVAFRLGNTGTEEIKLTVTTSGVNTTINDEVEFSTDNGLTWATTVSISGVKPNEITDRIIAKYKPVEGDVLGVGSFLIRVDEE